MNAERSWEEIVEEYAADLFRWKLFGLEWDHFKREMRSRKAVLSEKILELLGKHDCVSIQVPHEIYGLRYLRADEVKHPLDIHFQDIPEKLFVPLEKEVVLVIKEGLVNPASYTSRKRRMLEEDPFEPENSRSSAAASLSRSSSPHSSDPETPDLKGQERLGEKEEDFLVYLTQIFSVAFHRLIQQHFFCTVPTGLVTTSRKMVPKAATREEKKRYNVPLSSEELGNLVEMDKSIADLNKNMNLERGREINQCRQRLRTNGLILDDALPESGLKIELSCENLMVTGLLVPSCSPKISHPFLITVNSDSGFLLGKDEFSYLQNSSPKRQRFNPILPQADLRRWFGQHVLNHLRKELLLYSSTEKNDLDRFLQQMDEDWWLLFLESLNEAVRRFAEDYENNLKKEPGSQTELLSLPTLIAFEGDGRS